MYRSPSKRACELSRIKRLFKEPASNIKPSNVCLLHFGSQQGDAVQALLELRDDGYPGVPLLRQVLAAVGLPPRQLLLRLPRSLHRDALLATLPAPANLPAHAGASAPVDYQALEVDAGASTVVEDAKGALEVVRGAFSSFAMTALETPLAAVPLAGVTRLTFRCAPRPYAAHRNVPVRGVQMNGFACWLPVVFATQSRLRVPNMLGKCPRAFRPARCFGREHV